MSSDTTPRAEQPPHPAEPFRELQYQAVTARSLQLELLFWQVPQLSMTAHAFLLLGAFSGPTKVSRMILGLLGVGVAYLCVILMTRLRQAGLRDNDWASEYEQQRVSGQPTHGASLRVRRNAGSAHMGRLFDLPPFRRVQATAAWAYGELVLAVVGLAAAVLAIFTQSVPWL